MDQRPDPSAPEGVIALSSIVRVNGFFAEPIWSVIGDAWVADSYARAEQVSRLTPLPSSPWTATSSAVPGS